MNAESSLKKTMNILEFLELQSGNGPKTTLKNPGKSLKNQKTKIDQEKNAFLKGSSIDKQSQIKKTSLCNSSKSQSKQMNPNRSANGRGPMNKPCLARTQIMNLTEDQNNKPTKTNAFYSAHSNDRKPIMSSSKSNWLLQSVNNSFERSQLDNSFKISLEENHRHQTSHLNPSDNMILKFNRKPTEKKIKPLTFLASQDHEDAKSSLRETQVKPKAQQIQHSMPRPKEKQDKIQEPNPAKKGIYYTLSCHRHCPSMIKEDLRVEGYLAKMCQEFSAFSRFLGLLKTADKTILLPEKRDKGTPTIIIDLFNTLIKCKIKTEKNGLASLVIKPRPFLRFFLAEVSSRAELVVFSSSNSKLVEQVLDEIDPTRKYFSNVLTKEHCTPLYGT